MKPEKIFCSSIESPFIQNFQKINGYMCIKP